METLSCVVYGQEKTGIPLGASVLVLGTGTIRLMYARLAAINGAASVTVVDLFEDKLVLAKKWG